MFQVKSSPYRFYLVIINCVNLVTYKAHFQKKKRKNRKNFEIQSLDSLNVSHYYISYKIDFIRFLYLCKSYNMYIYSFI